MGSGRHGGKWVLWIPSEWAEVEEEVDVRWGGICMLLVG